MTAPATPPQLTDRQALARNRSRARPDALFLHEEARVEIQERLVEVNRTFTKPAVVTPFPEIWCDAIAQARIIPDAPVLDLEPGSCDLVIHALALHWADDPVGQLVQCRRALAPDGLFIALTFGGQTLHQLRSTLAEAEVAVTGGLSPRVLPMGEIRDLGALLQRAGFALPVADGYLRDVSYRDLFHLMQDLRLMGEASALAARSRHFSRREIFLRAARLYHENFGDAGGRIPATFDMVCLTGWAPHESQQKPLRPGSAVQRLEDALRAAREAGEPGATKNDS